MTWWILERKVGNDVGNLFGVWETALQAFQGRLTRN
jgi:hypothetical protein